MLETVFQVLFVVACALALWAAAGSPMLTLSGSCTKAIEPEPDKLPSSAASKMIFKAYMKLPEENRPPYDIEAALRALDTKYDIDFVDGHFVDHSTYYAYPLRFTFNCSCVWDGRTYEVIGTECSKFPEYRRLHEGIVEINKSLREREEENKRREHEMVLAGIESDLRSVEEITQALRSEKDLIDDVTKEICS